MTNSKLSLSWQLFEEMQTSRVARFSLCPRCSSLVTPPPFCFHHTVDCGADAGFGIRGIPAPPVKHA
jgi:hypothetical protein